MGKTFLGAGALSSLASGQFAMPFGASGGSTTEASWQVAAQGDFDVTHLRWSVQSGGSGNNTLFVRDNGVTGNNTITVAGAAAGEDLTNTDTIADGETLGYGYTDTGTNSVSAWIACTLEFAAGHRAIHGVRAGAAAGIVCDASGSTRFIALVGAVTTDFVTTEVNTRLLNRAYNELVAFQIYVVGNARVNDSTFRNRINGANGTGVITLGAGVTGRLQDTAVNDALADGDLINYSATLGVGVEDLTMNSVAGTYESGTSECEILAGGGSTYTRNASATANYIPLGTHAQNYVSAGLSEAACRVKIGYPGVARNLRIYVSANTNTGTATLKLYQNGSAAITLSIGSGVTGWVENTSDSVSYDDNDEFSFELDEGTSGSMDLGTMAFTSSHAADKTLAADAGAYAVTGQTAALKRGRKIAATAGSIAVTGQTAALKRGFKVAAAPGAHAVTGATVTFRRTYRISATPGAHAVTGATAALRQARKVAAEAGSIAVTGATALLKRGYKVVADAGSYSVSGGVVTFRRTWEIDAAIGSYALTGVAADAELGRKLTAAPGAYAMNGAVVALLRAWRVTAAPGAYLSSGTDAALKRGYKLAAEAGSYAIGGATVAFRRTYRIAAGAGSYSVSGSPAGLLQARRLAAAPGAYAVNGQAASLLRAYKLAASAGSYAVSGADVAFVRTYRLAVDAGSYSVNGQTATLLKSSGDKMFAVDAGAYAVNGQTASTLLGRLVAAEAGGYLVNGQAADLTIDVGAPPGGAVPWLWRRRRRFQ